MEVRTCGYKTSKIYFNIERNGCLSFIVVAVSIERN